VPRLGRTGRGLRKAAVHGDVGRPPATAELWGADGIVVEGPQRAIAETGVEGIHLVPGEGDGRQRDALMLEGVELAVRLARPPHPPPAAVAQNRRHGGHEAARADLPPRLGVAYG